MKCLLCTTFVRDNPSERNTCAFPDLVTFSDDNYNCRTMARLQEIAEHYGFARNIGRGPADMSDDDEGHREADMDVRSTMRDNVLPGTQRGHWVCFRWEPFNKKFWDAVVANPENVVPDPLVAPLELQTALNIIDRFPTTGDPVGMKTYDDLRAEELGTLATGF